MAQLHNWSTFDIYGARQGTFISIMRPATCKLIAGILLCDYIPPQLRQIGQAMSEGRCRQARLLAPGHMTTFLPQLK